MVRKKVDGRVRSVIEDGVKTGHRTLICLVGDHGKDQVVNLHYILSRAQVKARPSVLWCYKKELGFSTHKKKRMRQIKKAVQRGLHNPDQDDPFDLFVCSTNIRWCYYTETHKVLGNTFGMCVIQDFEAMTPNLLARTIETVEGGGIVVVLFRTVNSLKQLYTMTMDVHARFRTEAHADVVARFNERFILSLATCGSCLVLDDELNVLPLSKNTHAIEAISEESSDGLSKQDQELLELNESLVDREPFSALVGLAKTVDQGKAIMTFLEAIQEKTLNSTVSVTASRGRGKSAAIGLCLAGAIAFGYSNIYVTAPSPENLQAVFQFIKLGLDALKYNEHMDYEILYSHDNDQNKIVVRINVFRNHRQTIQYIEPNAHMKLSQAEIVAIDEAAAIPLPVIKNLLGPYLVFMSSTISGYEGTGRSLSLKLLQQLRESQSQPQQVSSSRRKLKEVQLEVPIRYSVGDPVEKWLNELLCLEAKVSSHRLITAPPAADECKLFYVDRDVLFSFHKASEAFLHRIMAILTSAHYKNQPNDLQLMSDAPAHHLYVLLGPSREEKVPDVLCVIQVALEGHISKSTVANSLARGHRAFGDLIPWTISSQYQDSDFANLSGARIVRIATHPDAQRLGYGSRALKELIAHFQGGGGKDGSPTIKIRDITGDDDNDGGGKAESEKSLLSEKVKPRKLIAPLLTPLEEKKSEALDWIGTSFGLTENLLGFWNRMEFSIVYLRQTTNDLTGEHTTIMLRKLDRQNYLSDVEVKGQWLQEFTQDALRRISRLLPFEFQGFSSKLALSVLDNLRRASPDSHNPVTPTQLRFFLNEKDLGRLLLYARNLVDYHMVKDLMPVLSQMYFMRQLPASTHLSHLMEVILVGVGLQNHTIDQLAEELKLPGDQVLSVFNKVVRKIGGVLQEIHNKIEQTNRNKKLNGQASTLGEGSYQENGKVLVAKNEKLHDAKQDQQEKAHKSGSSEKKRKEESSASKNYLSTDSRPPKKKKYKNLE